MLVASIVALVALISGPPAEIGRVSRGSNQHIRRAIEFGRGDLVVGPGGRLERIHFGGPVPIQLFLSGGGRTAAACREPTRAVQVIIAELDRTHPEFSG